MVQPIPVAHDVKKKRKKSPCAPTTLAPYHRAGFSPLRRRAVAPPRAREQSSDAGVQALGPSPPPCRSPFGRTPPCTQPPSSRAALQEKSRLVAGERHEDFPGRRRPQRLPLPLLRCLQQPGAPRSDAVGEAGAGGRFPQRIAGAGCVPGSRGGAQGAALQVEGVADHEDPALEARLQLLWLQAYNRVPEAMRYR